MRWNMKAEIKKLIKQYKKEINNLKRDDRFSTLNSTVQTVSVLREVVNDLEILLKDNNASK